MKTSLKVILTLTILAAFIWACSSNDDIEQMMDDDVAISDDVDPIDDIDPTDDDPTSNTFEMVDVQVTLPNESSFDLTGASVLSMGKSSNVSGGIATDIPFNPGTIELAYLLDADDNLILAGFVSDDTKEISIETTAGVLLYFGMVSSLRDVDYKNLFVESISNTAPFAQFSTTLGNLFMQNNTIISEGGYINALNSAIASFSEKEVIDVTNKIDFGGVDRSGLALNDIGDKSFNVTNSYPRRAHAFLYKKSYKNLLGEETVINSEIEGNDTADRELDIPSVSLSDENSENFQGQTTNFNLCSQGARYAFQTSDNINIELGENRSAETYELSIVGPGRGTASQRNMTVKENEKFEELSIETFIMDYFIPVLMDIGGNRDVYSTKALQSVGSLTATVEPILRAHGPSINAVLESDFENALKEFLPFLYTDIRLSNDLRTIMTGLYGIISDGNSPNTFIQNNELIQEGEARYLSVSTSILKALKESVGINCVNQRLGVSSKLEKWDITISEGLVKLKPEQMITVPFTEGKEINARVFFDLQNGEELEYQWSTTTQFGGVLYDLDNDQNGSSFTTSNSKVSFISNASTAQLSEGENLETVSVKVFVKSGGTRDEIGEATMTVDVKKEKFEIRPKEITIEGNDKVNLNLVHNDGITVIPNDDMDYEVVWTTTGNYGLIRGYNISETNYNEGFTNFEAFDTEVEEGVDVIKAEIFARPKNSNESFKLVDETEARITVKNEENIKYLYPKVGQLLYDDPNGTDGAYGYFVFFEFAPDPNAESYSLTVKELKFGNNTTSFVGSGKSWTAGNEADLTDGNYRYTTYTGSGPGTARADAAAALATLQGFAQVRVVLKPE
ncbi:MAG: hypothetical protein AB8B59_06775 [Maribacter sp.]